MALTSDQLELMSLVSEQQPCTAGSGFRVNTELQRRTGRVSKRETMSKRTLSSPCPGRQTSDQLHGYHDVLQGGSQYQRVNIGSPARGKYGAIDGWYCVAAWSSQGERRAPSFIPRSSMTDVLQTLSLAAIDPQRRSAAF